MVREDDVGVPRTGVQGTLAEDDSWRLQIVKSHGEIKLSLFKNEIQ